MIILKCKSDDISIIYQSYQSPFLNVSSLQVVQNPSSFLWFTDTVGLLSSLCSNWSLSPLFLHLTLATVASCCSLSASSPFPPWELCRFCICSLQSSFLGLYIQVSTWMPQIFDDLDLCNSAEGHTEEQYACASVHVCLSSILECSLSVLFCLISMECV